MSEIQGKLNTIVDSYDSDYPIKLEYDSTHNNIYIETTYGNGKFVDIGGLTEQQIIDKVKEMIK